MYPLLRVAPDAVLKLLLLDMRESDGCEPTLLTSDWREDRKLDEECRE